MKIAKLNNNKTIDSKYLRRYILSMIKQDASCQKLEYFLKIHKTFMPIIDTKTTNNKYIYTDNRWFMLLSYSIYNITNSTSYV